MNTLRIAMLSFAHVHSDDYARQVNAHPEAEIVCIWDDNETRGQAAAGRYNVPYERDLDAVLRRDDIDAVLVDSPTSQHTEILLAAANAGKHIFTEKALTVTTPDADRVVEAVRASGKQFVISLPSRTNAEILFMKNVIDQGLLGKVTLMRARVAHMAALDHWFHDGSSWFGDASLAGGGALFDLGCHTVDVMRWFMGKPKSIIAKVQNFSGAYDIDDNCVAVVEFENGGLGILDVSWVHRAGPNPYEIYGTEGFVGRDNTPGQRILFNSRNLSAPNLPQGYILPTQLPDALPMPFQQFVSACLHGTQPTITVEDGRNLTEMLEGIYTAARTGSEHRFGGAA